MEATSYGNSANKNVHQTGFRLDGGLKQEQPYIKNKHYNFSKVGKIPARPWFPTQDSVEGSKNINKKFETDKDIPQFPKPIKIVIGGGTSMVPGFIDLFNESSRSNDVVSSNALLAPLIVKP